MRLAGAFGHGSRQLFIEHDNDVVLTAWLGRRDFHRPAAVLADGPLYAVLGENYTLRVVIQNNADIVVPVVVQVTTPVGAIFVHPRVIRMSVAPSSSMVANFTILPFGHPRTGPYNVTALLFVFFPLSMSSPLLVDRVTATVSTIGPNPFPYLDVVLVSAAAVVLVVVAVFYGQIFAKAHRVA